MQADKIADFLKRSRVYPVVNDLTDEIEDCSELKTLAMRVARTFTLKPVLQSSSLSKTGDFYYIPDNLLFTSIKGINVDHFDDDHEFFVDHVRSPELLDRLKRDLGEANRDWDFDRMADTYWNGPNSAVIRTTDERGDSIGVAIFRRDVSIDVYDDATVLLYEITPEFVFVKTNHRGENLSTALRHTIVQQMSIDIEKIAAHWNSGKIQTIAPVQLQFSVNGDAYTNEGEQFVLSLGENMKELVEEAFTKSQLENDFFFKHAPVNVECCI